MKLQDVHIKNFRGYRELTTITFNDLTCLVGKNDAGKSTALEALDFFFNEGGSNGIIKIDKGDCSIESGEDEILIGATFTDIPKKIILDTSVETSLAEEFLLNKDGNLQVHKIIKNGKVISTKIIANYPKGQSNVHDLTLPKLKKIAKEKNIEVSDERIASLYRKAILNSYDKNELGEIEIETKSDSGKAIWEELKKYLPIYSLFQSDRKNQDKDGEVQDPMKEAVKEVLSNKEILDTLDTISDKVISAVKDVTERTLIKLAEMNPEIARELEPEIPKKIEWDKVFNFGLNSDNGIPLNKRGSGVRRMILLNFFRAQADKRREEKSSVSIIYAFEEPETAQHPDYQKKLIESFVQLSQDENTQIIFTTHSPDICNMVPVESLRLIDKSRGNKFDNPSEEVLTDIVGTLGVLPSIASEIEQNVRKVKVAVCVEGKNDVNFLKNINENIEDFKNLIDLNSERVIIIPMGGSSLKDWVNERYLQKLDLNQVHIYDSDRGSKVENKYKKEIIKLNKLSTSKAFATNFREMENYVHHSILEDDGIKFEAEYLELDKWSRLDIPEYCARYSYDNNPQAEKKWSELDKETKSDKVSKMKKRMNLEYSKSITKEMLEEMDAFEEVEGWFTSISKFGK
ncbi:MAG: ATP-binding protein [Paraclostridium sp.]